MTDRRLLRLDPDGLVEVADLSELAPFHCNDMVVDSHGRAYIGNFGFDLDAGDEPTGTTLVCVEPDGEAWVVVEQLLFPNGLVITDRGQHARRGRVVRPAPVGLRHPTRRLARQPAGLGRPAPQRARRHLPRRRRRHLGGRSRQQRRHAGDGGRRRRRLDPDRRLRPSPARSAAPTAARSTSAPRRRSNPQKCIDMRSARIEVTQVEVPYSGYVEPEPDPAVDLHRSHLQPG